MKLITKMVTGLVTVIAVVVLGHFVFQSLSEKNVAEQLAAEKEVYMKKVVTLLENSDSRWFLDIKLPNTPERIQWNAEYEMPRVMFLAKHYSKDKSRSLWSMNINATDIKLMISFDEIENMRMNELDVSPDGRYLFANSEYRSFKYKCYLYDLKEQKAKYISHDRCGAVNWIDGTNDAIIFNGYGPAVFTIADKKLKRVNELLGYDARSRYNGINTGAGGWLSNDGKKFIRYATEDAHLFYDETTQGEGDFVVYDANTFMLIDKTDYFPKGCNNFINYSVDGNFFTCRSNKTIEESGVSFPVYNAKPPFEIVDYAPEIGVVQPGFLYTDLRHKLFRNKKYDEQSPIEKVMYWYSTEESSLTHLYFYLSPNLKKDYKNNEVTNFLPPLPTQAQVAEAKRRIQEGS